MKFKIAITLTILSILLSELHPIPAVILILTAGLLISYNKGV